MGKSLIHSCTSELTRQGIWLTSVASTDLARKFEADLHCKSPYIAVGVGLYLNRSSAISGVESLRILDTAVSLFDSSASKGSLSSPNLPL